MSISIAPSLHTDINANNQIPPRTLRKYQSHASFLNPIIQLVRHPVTSLGSALGPIWTTKQNEEATAELETQNRREVLLQRMKDAIDLKAWQTAAEELDEIEGNNKWKEDPHSPIYDHELLQDRLTELEAARMSKDPSRMLWLIRNFLTRSLGNMGDLQLYKYSHVGTKYLIEDYISIVSNTLESFLECYDKVKSPLESRYVYEELLRTRQYFGRSALLLSGGGTFGMTHSGVVKVLWENNLLPRIISGSSAGSIIASVVCVKTDEEMSHALYAFAHGDMEVFERSDESNIMRRAVRMLTTKSIFDPQHLIRVMQSWLGDMTFLESYNRTRRILNISVSSTSMNELPRLMNYVTAPNVVIWSAVVASCSVPLFFSPTSIVAKDPKTGETGPWNPSQQYIDGSVDNDLPMTRLSEMFNVNHFIVSQVNPHVVPFLDSEIKPASDGIEYPKQTYADSSGVWRMLGGMAKGEAIHRMHQLSEFGIFPTTLSKARSVLSQKYSGDITILPVISLSMVPRVLQNPDQEFMELALLSGQRATWPKLSRVQNHLAIELAIDKTVQKLRMKMAFSPSQVNLRMMSLGTGKNARVNRPRHSRQAIDARVMTRSWCAEPSATHLSQLAPNFTITPQIKVHGSPIQRHKSHVQVVSPDTDDYMISDSDDEYEEDDEDDEESFTIDLSRTKHKRPMEHSSPEGGAYDSNTSNLRSRSPSPPDSPHQIPLQFPIGFRSQPATPYASYRTRRRSSPDSFSPDLAMSRYMVDRDGSQTSKGEPSEAERRYKRIFHGIDVGKSGNSIKDGEKDGGATKAAASKKRFWKR